MNHTAFETALVDQVELNAHVIGEGWVATAAHDGVEEQVVLVDQSGLDRMRGELGTADGQVLIS